MIRHLLLIGAQRSGTTWLRAVLDAHPTITMARPASPEPKVFCDPEASARGVDWYRQTFFGHARSETLLGDKSTSYLEVPRAAAHARDMLGQVHVLAVLRDPVQRAVSNWQLSTQQGLESRSLEEALRANLTGTAQTWDTERTSVSPFAYLERGKYLKYLEPWLTEFPATSHVLFLEELVQDAQAARALWEALGVDPEVGPERLIAPVNSSEGVLPEMSAELAEMLASYFEVSNRELSDRLGRALTW